MEPRAKDTALRSAFAHFDKTGKGEIKVAELGTCLRAFGLAPTESHITTYTKARAPDALLSFDEVHAIYKQDANELKPATYDELLAAMSNFEDSGKISIVKLREMLTLHGDRLSDEEFDDLLHSVHTQGDQFILVKQLVELITSKGGL